MTTPLSLPARLPAHTALFPQHHERSWGLSRRLIFAASATVLTVGCLSLGAPTTAMAAPAVPKNIIVMIGDGMGYNTLDLANLYYRKSTGYQVLRPGARHNATPRNTSQPGFQRWPHVGMSTYAAIGAYDTRINWSTIVGATGIPTDSAAAGTAMATGHKTFQGVVGMDVFQNPLENLTERAKKLGKSAGVVSSVPYSHATPAAYAAHEPLRANYHNITKQMLESRLDVVIAPGHPWYNDDNQRNKIPDYTYITSEDWTQLHSGKTNFSFLDSNTQFAELARTNKDHQGKRIWGVPRVATTLQQGRTSVLDDVSDELVNQTPRNNVPTLSELSLGALNVLDDNPRGSFLMIEGGAIDWAGHDNETARSIEETEEFVKAVNDVATWVEKYSSWEETLLVVTADHETGFLNGASKVDFAPLTKGPKGALHVEWLSEEHTNQLVPFFVRGAGSRAVLGLADQHDMVRGKYMDNTEFPRLVMQRWWITR